MLMCHRTYNGGSIGEPASPELLQMTSSNAHNVISSQYDNFS